ncbi:MAG: aminotransferase class I/II-fold pyridoxal phosphate-dependent enzyme [Nanohaloarchaea archaeon]|nr:aminotransferase class I/II-fold pyridoxal phosphate-dependent enzyme [Candidatus Nanohaloarchaea archaeon]
MRERIENIELSIRKISEKAREQDKCVRFDIGQPSFDTPEHVKKAAADGIVEQKQGYTSVTGIEKLRKAIVEEEGLKQKTGPKNAELSKENVMVATGGMGAIYSVFAAMLDSNKEAVFNDPCWGPYKLMSEVNGNQWTQVEYFDGEELRDEAKQEMKDAELVVVNTPSNPTGRMLTEKQAKNIGKFCEENDVMLLSDEVYHRLNYGKTHYSPAAYCENSVVIGSVSKNHAMTGWRIGWVVGREDDIENFAKVARGATACPPKPSQIAALEALENDSHVEEMRQVYEERRDLLVERMNELGWDFQMPEGAIYAFPEVKEDSWDFCLDMIEEGVAMVPGEPMGPESDQNVRICFGSTTKEEINKAFDILEEEL